MVKTMQALRYVEIAPAQAGLGSNEISVPYGTSGSVALVRRDGLNSLYVAFQDKELGNSTENWATSTTRVPFLQDVRKTLMLFWPLCVFVYLKHFCFFNVSSSSTLLKLQLPLFLPFPNSSTALLRAIQASHLLL
jgi:hypothetical protein